MTENKPRVIRGRTELIVPHGDGEIAFVHPPQGPDTYQNVGREVLARNLTVPTGYQIASLVYGAYNSQEPEFQKVQEIMKNNWLWVFNRNLWTPEGVYVAHDQKAIGNSQALSRDYLEQRLQNGKEADGIRFSDDMKFSFAPKETYKIGEHTSESLTRDGFMVASFGEEGAKKLAEISREFEYNPRTWGLDIKEGEETRVSALDSSGGLDYDRLGIGGDSHGDDRIGYAFGVKNTGEASRAEK